MENACGQLIWATLLLLPLCLWEAPWQMPLPPAGALLAVASMAMFSTYCAFLLYFYLIRTIGAVNTTQTAFIIPLVAVILGVMLLNENIGTAFFVGASLVMFGLLIANRRTEPGDDNCKK
jgi:drug/metabolite transporter (DMT)-like permease